MISRRSTRPCKSLISKPEESNGSLEQKDPVELDIVETEALVNKVICDDYVTVINNLLRHNVLKLSMHIFGYLLEQK